MSANASPRGDAQVISGETELAMTIRHVRDGQAHVDRQRQIVAELETEGHPAAAARNLLATFEHTLALHRQHLARLSSDQA